MKSAILLEFTFSLRTPFNIWILRRQAEYFDRAHSKASVRLLKLGVRLHSTGVSSALQFSPPPTLSQLAGHFESKSLLLPSVKLLSYFVCYRPNLPARSDVSVLI